MNTNRTHFASVAAGILLLFVFVGCAEDAPVSADIGADTAVEDSGLEEVSTDLITDSVSDVAPLDTAIDAVEDIDLDVADAPEEPLPLFASQTLTQINLTFSEEALATLESAEGDAIVTGNVQVDDVELFGIEVSRHGLDGTMVTVAEKPGFFLRLDPGNLGQQIEGYTSLILDNLHNDAGMIREHILNLLYRESDVPAPETKYAWLSVNGEAVGLYLLMEPMSDPLFQAKWFEPGGVLYWGSKATDVNNDGIGKFIHRAGVDEDKGRLKALVASLDALGEEDIYGGLSQLFDMDRFMRFAALEVIGGVRRGYLHGKRNYGLYQNPADDRWTFLPLEMSRTMREGFNALSSKTRIHSLCLNDQSCRFKLGDALAELAERIDAIHLVDKILLSKPFLLDMAALDTRIEYTLEEVEQSINATASFILYQPDWVLMNLECIDPSKVDVDGDGYSGCGEDCDDKVATTHPNAPELCNLVDDDCNGVLDDAPECPQCQDFTLDNGDPFELCFQQKNYADAQADCVAKGGHLASIRNQSEHQQLVSASLGLWWTSWWIGLDDIAEEGTFVWQDGTPLDYTAWADNEPNDSNGEDCGHFWGATGGLWNDIPCTNEMPYICRFEKEEEPNPEDGDIIESPDGDVIEDDDAGPEPEDDATPTD
jgi:spore coat protein CotH